MPETTKCEAAAKDCGDKSKCGSGDKKCCKKDESSTPPPAPPTDKKLKACCACPETKKPRDKCIVEMGEENCQELIEAHKQCMRKLGFNI